MLYKVDLHPRKLGKPWPNHLIRGAKNSEYLVRKTTEVYYEDFKLMVNVIKNQVILHQQLERYLVNLINFCFPIEEWFFA